MDGALEANLTAFADTGGIALHGVDATNLNETLWPQLDEANSAPFDFVVFPFPRATLQRGSNPVNSRLLREFFLGLDNYNVLATPESGRGVPRAQLVLLRPQFAEWDVAC